MKKKIFTKDNLIFFLILNLGLIFTAVGISIFKTPNHFAFGGTSGLSIILSTLFPKWNVGAFMWIVNAALVVLGFFFLGIRSMGWTIYSSFALSFYVSACEVIYPLSFPLTHDVFLELGEQVVEPLITIGIPQREHTPVSTVVIVGSINHALSAHLDQFLGGVAVLCDAHVTSNAPERLFRMHVDLQRHTIGKADHHLEEGARSAARVFEIVRKNHIHVQSESMPEAGAINRSVPVQIEDGGESLTMQNFQNIEFRIVLMRSDHTGEPPQVTNVEVHSPLLP